MKREFDIHYWNTNNYKLKKRYPQLTDADLIWRHETKENLFRTIAEKLGMRTTDLEEIIASL